MIPEKMIGKPVGEWTAADAKKYSDYRNDPSTPYESAKPCEANEWGYIGSKSHQEDIAKKI